MKMIKDSRHRGLWGIAVQDWRRLTQFSFFLIFIFAPILDLFRLDLHLKHFIIFGQHWTLGLDHFEPGKTPPYQAAIAIFLRVILPLVSAVAMLVFISWKWGRIYCGWLCPHFSVVETINQALRKAIAKQSIWDSERLPQRNPDGSETRSDKKGWWLVIALSAGFACLWALVLLTYLLPPAEIYTRLWEGTLTPNQSRFIVIASLAFFIEFTLARHLFCRYGCALGLFQSLVWMANKRAMVMGYQRHRAKDCATCYNACDHVCPMRLQPRSVKRMMFACVQCGQCADACHQTQASHPNGALLEWLHHGEAESEASLNHQQAKRGRVIHIKNLSQER